MNKDETVEQMAKDLVDEIEFDITFYDFNGSAGIRFDYVGTAKNVVEKGYRKVADDEIVIKKSELGKVVISHERADIVDMLNQETRELQRANAIKQETAREILQVLEDNIIEVDFGCGAGVYEVVDMDTDELKQLAKAYGIELE